MDHLWLLLAFLCLLTGTIWAGIVKLWPVAFIGAGLLFWLLHDSGPIKIG